jgi:hypothetical protein
VWAINLPLRRVKIRTREKAALAVTVVMAAKAEATPEYLRRLCPFIPRRAAF